MYCIDLTGKVAIVTGGTKGIGKAIVELFVESGAKVAIVGRRQELCDEVAAEFGVDHVFPFAADVSKKQDIERMVSATKEHFGRIDILVNNAGSSTMDYVEDIKEEDWDSIMDLNAKGVFLASQNVIKMFKEQGEGGRIITIASQAGKNGYRCMGNYVASKHAVLGLTKVMALELAKEKILVNAVCPGIIETDMKRIERVWGGNLRGMKAEEVEQEDNSQVPLGRTGQPRDVANVVLFLASELASYMTGQSINVTGGMTMN
ncbi:SDR family NAD(P)-dependent oxidoreductase [Sporosarcina thermotolerans]|uniref:SDR family NAD(P)-dependent oxidoreductase n=1 Tax=Sporosarcina thermotolerans TaxID=633404 RepID=A0AAW9A7B7_9BACL|nr:SDR family NAD(P)-dependent oxidoreductase [Sporosarcina thermotolerans]MDW0116134.1 SDR family NAD(P)-dependent oxidoreductase [Sporosarcina thermotolerans]WHT48104.1 SDR family NAD(P)-dependent oxidoreductase [Sporosarcina thermotolerans]